MIFYLTAIANGFLNTINKMVNVKAGESLGTANGALINYIEASVIAFCLIFATGNGVELHFSHIKEAPILFYLGSVCGLIAMIFLIIGTSYSGAMLSTVLILIGQLGTAISLDYVFFGCLGIGRIVGILLIVAGIAWMEKQKISLQQESVRKSLSMWEEME
ncbi:MAG: DMT family transporter [Anaerotignum sp.]|nr:DMT family transporter [Anaerotignum sp.]